MELKVLGTGCSKCRSTVALIERVALGLNVEVKIINIENLGGIKRQGVVSMPAVIIDGKVVHSGSISSHAKVQGWLEPKALGFLNQPTRHLFVYR